MAGSLRLSDVWAFLARFFAGAVLASTWFESSESDGSEVFFNQEGEFMVDNRAYS